MFADSANTAGDIVMYDRLTDTLERLTKGVGNGGPCNQPSVNAVISRDGSTVSFDSTATNLGPVGTGLFTISRTTVNSPIRIPLLAGQVVAAMDVGHYEKIGAISGSVFVDANGNGLRDVGETASRHCWERTYRRSESIWIRMAMKSWTLESRLPSPTPVASTVSLN